MHHTIFKYTIVEHYQKDTNKTIQLCLMNLVGTCHGMSASHNNLEFNV